ncbi:MAG: FAD-dependent oxidoreductase [Acidobacteriia bacterium]|nr:FAD-dependent oxidoreductase [Terriglobia bacterium]
MYDLVVIGGGPAGAAAAITAARAGAQVLLLERGKYPRHKVCGEFVSAESLHVLLELLDGRRATLQNDAVRVAQSRVFLDDRVLHTPVEPAGASIARLELDAALWESAAACGVDARQQVTVQKIGGTGPFIVTTSSGDFKARAVIDASGRWSNLNPGPVSNGGRARWIGLKAHFAEITPPASVDLYFFEGGYCGVQPVDLTGQPNGGRVNACAMVRAEVASTLHEVFALHPALGERARQWRSLSEPVSTSPLLFAEPQPERDGILKVGDAAGFVDPFVGDGISLALRSGQLAAQCLIPFFTGKASLEEAQQQYVETYRNRFTPVFRMASRIRRTMAWPRAVRAPILTMLQRVPRVTKYLARKTR